MAERWKLEVPVALSGPIWLRRGAAIVGLVVGVTLAYGGSFGIAQHVEGLPGSFAALLLFGGAIQLFRMLWRSEPRRALRVAEVRGRGELMIGTQTIGVRSLRYEGAKGLLWVRGPLDVTRACLELSRQDAWALKVALDRPEFGIHRLPATPPMMGLPIVGTFLGIGLAALTVTSLIMAALGPRWLGITGATIFAPLALLLLRPARVHITPTQLERHWWAARRRIPLDAIEWIEATPAHLEITLADGSVQRWHMRSSDKRWAREPQQGDALQAFAEYVLERAEAHDADPEAASARDASRPKSF